VKSNLQPNLPQEKNHVLSALNAGGQQRVPAFALLVVIVAGCRRVDLIIQMR